jgi:hypothetical protein
MTAVEQAAGHTRMFSCNAYERVLDELQGQLEEHWFLGLLMATDTETSALQADPAVTAA